jgi:di-N-acetylchitobiase
LSTQIFGFSVRRQQDYESSYDFSQLTTVAWNTDPSLVCAAHRHGARVVMNAEVQDLRLFEEAAARAAWIQPLVQLATDRCLDGINFDFEGPIPACSVALLPC